MLKEKGIRRMLIQYCCTLMIPFSDPGSHMTDKKGVASVGGDWTGSRDSHMGFGIAMETASKKWEGLVRFPWFSTTEWRNKNLAVQIGNRLKR